MRYQTPTQLVIIIDEVLALVGALGLIVNEEGKKEPRMAHFIRTMGYSARHRNIKIILIGQGKNLADLGLNSGTARNNYALVRAARNAATNQRSAFIDTDEGEQSLDVQEVLRLAQGATHHARAWMKHNDLETHESHEIKVDDLLSDLLSTVPVHLEEKADFGASNTSIEQYGTSGTNSNTMPNTASTALPSDAEAQMIRNLLQGYSKNKIAELLGGSKTTAYQRIDRALGG